MLQILENKYGKLQDENLNLMVAKLNGNKEVEKQLYINYTLLTKIGQMIRNLK